MIHEGAPLGTIELPRSLQLEPVGRRRMSRRLSPVSIKVDGVRNGPPGLLTFDAFCRIIDSLPELESLRLQGEGEPLAHPRFFDMVRYAAARGIHVSATSRLQMFNQRRAEECVKSGLREIHIPLDAAGTRDYDFSRTGPRHERLLRHLRFLTEARKASGSPWPQVTLTAVVMRRNVAGLGAVVRLAHEYGADGVAVQGLEQFIDASGIAPEHRRIRKFIESEALTSDDAEATGRYFAQARDTAEELHVQLALPPMPAEERAPCPWPWHAACVSFSGEARPCGRGKSVSFGNVLKDGLVPVWRSDAYREFRERHLSGDLPGICETCPRSSPPA